MSELASIREQLGYTAYALGKRLGVPPSTISRAEQPGANPDPRYIVLMELLRDVPKARLWLKKRVKS